MDQLVRQIGNLLEDKHAKDIEVFELGAKHPMFDNVIIASVDVDRNLYTVVQAFKEADKKGELSVKHIDDSSNEWVLIDCNDVLVHVMLKEARAYYNLEQILQSYV